jgi:hypothetical protein
MTATCRLKCRQIEGKSTDQRIQYPLEIRSKTMEHAALSRIERLRLAPRAPGSLTSKSRITNGRLLAGTDLRSANARRFRDILRAITREQGRELTVSETGLARAAATLLVRGETLQGQAVRGEQVDADELIRTASEARRLLAMLGKRTARREPEQSLSAYLSEISSGGAEVSPAVAQTAGASETASGGKTAVRPRKRAGGRTGARQRASYAPTSDGGGK